MSQLRRCIRCHIKKKIKKKSLFWKLLDLCCSEHLTCQAKQLSSLVHPFPSVSICSCLKSHFFCELHGITDILSLWKAASCSDQHLRSQVSIPQLLITSLNKTLLLMCCLPGSCQYWILTELLWWKSCQRILAWREAGKLCRNGWVEAVIPLIISKYNVERLLESLSHWDNKSHFDQNLAFLWSSTERPAWEFTALTFITVILIIPPGFYHGHFAFHVLIQSPNTFFSSPCLLISSFNFYFFSCKIG